MKKTGLAALAILCWLIALNPVIAFGEAEETQYYLRVSNYDDICMGTQLEPYVYILNEDGTRTAVYEGVRNWETSDPSVIDFRKNYTNNFVAVGYGRADISVTAPNGMVLSHELHVMEPPQSLMINPKAVTLHEGETFQLSFDAEGGDSTYHWSRAC